MTIVRRSYSVESMHMFQQLSVHIAGAAQQGQMLVIGLSNWIEPNPYAFIR